MLELRPTCEHRNKHCRWTRLRRVSAPTSAPSALLVSNTSWEMSAQIAAVGSSFDRFGLRRIGTRQLPVKRSGEHQGDTPADRFGGACPLLGQGQDDPTGETIGS
jgi:hypothetical protein